MSQRVIAVTGGKGGVGKSTTTINLGVSLRLDGHSVVLIDADVEMPNLVELLDVEPEHTIHEVLSGTARPEEALIEIGPGFGVVPGDSALSGYSGTEPVELKRVIDSLGDYEFVLLDTGAGLSYDAVMPLVLADEIVIVSSPDSAAVENAKRTQAFVHKLNREITGVVITKADSSVDGSIVDQFDADLLGVIPEDRTVRFSTAASVPLEVYDPKAPAAEAYRQVEANLTDGVLPPARTAKPSEETPADDGAPEAEDDEPEPGPEAPAEGEPTRDDPDKKKRGLIGRLVGR